MSIDWTNILTRVIDTPCCDRPFVCDGFPDACDVVLIGKNPKMPLGVDWWSFWSNSLGFDYDNFMTVYLNASMGKISDTRKFYLQIREIGCNSLETNVYRHTHGSKTVCNRDVLNALLDNLSQQKRVGIIPHGKEAQSFIDNYPIPKAWCLIDPPVKKHLGWMKDPNELERVKQFCKDSLNR